MKKKRILPAIMAVALLVGSASLAYFTDRAESTFNAKAGTVCLNQTSKHAELDNMAPGDKRPFGFTYENKGDLALDTRITYYGGVSRDENNIQGSKMDEILTLLQDGKELGTFGRYTANEPIAQVEGPTINGVKEQAGVDLLEANLELELNPDVPNGFQNASFYVVAIIEGKQHKNGAEWELMNTEELTVTLGNEKSKTEVVSKSNCHVREEEANTSGMKYFWVERLSEESKPIAIHEIKDGSTINVQGLEGELLVVPESMLYKDWNTGKIEEFIPTVESLLPVAGAHEYFDKNGIEIEFEHDEKLDTIRDSMGNYDMRSPVFFTSSPSSRHNSGPIIEGSFAISNEDYETSGAFSNEVIVMPFQKQVQFDDDGYVSQKYIDEYTPTVQFKLNGQVKELTIKDLGMHVQSDDMVVSGDNITLAKNEAEFTLSSDGDINVIRALEEFKDGGVVLDKNDKVIGTVSSTYRGWHTLEMNKDVFEINDTVTIKLRSDAAIITLDVFAGMKIEDRPDISKLTKADPEDVWADGILKFDDVGNTFKVGDISSDHISSFIGDSELSSVYFINKDSKVFLSGDLDDRGDGRLVISGYNDMIVELAKKGELTFLVTSETEYYESQVVE